MGKGLNLGIRAGTVSKGTLNLSITWVPFAPYHSASLRAAASASHLQVAAPPRATLACLPLAPYSVLVPGAFGEFIHQTRRQWLASCPLGKREGPEGVAVSPASHPPDPAGTQAHPQRVGKAERGGQLTLVQPYSNSTSRASSSFPCYT